MSATTNPTIVKVIDATPRTIDPPDPEVVAKQDPAHTEGDFLRDLDRATSNRAKERLAEKNT